MADFHVVRESAHVLLDSSVKTRAHHEASLLSGSTRRETHIVNHIPSDNFPSSSNVECTDLIKDANEEKVSHVGDE